LEEDIVFFLFQKATPAHELQSTFMRDSIRGWVYLETTMNQNLRHLLKRTPGVIVRRPGLISQRIEFKDWLSLLKMHDSKVMPQIGKWVEVQKGIYKGDVGYVDSVETWGVQLLLIPRLPPPTPSYISSSKRKHTQPRPLPALFDPVVIKQTHNIEPTHVQKNVYSFKGYDFDHGLILKTYNFNAISMVVHHMPLALFCLFRESRHPKVIASECAIPRPLEWEFTQGDEVDVFPSISTWPPSSKHGIITSLLPDSVEVDLSTKEGIVCASWMDIRKAIHPGDYVEITGGQYRGRTGWFQEIRNVLLIDEVASVIEVEDIRQPLPNRIQVQAY
jgi:transcription antitermination factor NusG